MPNLPERMQAVEITGPGGPEVLRPCERATPAAGAGEVLIRVEAAGVNRPDVFQRQGFYPPPPGASDLPGLEVAGVVVEVGAGVDGWHVGDPVCALLAGGGYAQYAVAPAGQCLPWPAGLDAAGAASLPETAFTVWTNVFERGGFRAGDTVLVHGGSSGIGVMAIQLCRTFGATVLTTVGSSAKQALCRELGAARAINYREEDFVDAVRAETGGAGADLILDMIGGDYLARNMEAAAEEGRIVSIASLGGGRPALDIMRMMSKRLTLTGSTLRSRPLAAKAAIAAQLRKRVWPLIARGEVRPIVHAVFPLAQACEAHRLMESSAHAGKIVLTVADGPSP
jgi:NADPH:quinone reductase